MPTHQTYTVDQAKAKLEAYCAYQERCYQEVTRKLTQMRMIPQAQDAVIAHLTKHDFLNETRFAQAFARGKFRIKKWGRQRITRELKARKISVYNVKMALKEIPEAKYMATFHALAEHRALQIKETDLQKKRKKLADYLLYRGWESHLVYDKIRELMP